MILVYEIVENGTLRIRLCGSELPALSSEICIGSARGLHYLQTGFDKANDCLCVCFSSIYLDYNF